MADPDGWPENNPLCGPHIFVEQARRKHLRLAGFDYSLPGAYFVTICTHRRRCVLGKIANSTVRLNALGRLADGCWTAIPNHFPEVQLDEFVVMPNHIHGILWLREQRAESYPRQGPPLPTIIGSFKAAAARQAGVTLWQRNYFEHVIRSEKTLNRIRQYIADNPQNWSTDPENRA